MTKTYGTQTAVADVSFDVPESKMMVLLGPSGCGKTTTMRCIAGLETPTKGRIEIGSQTVFDDARSINTPVNRRNVGMVFQSYAIWPHMTVAENVAFPLEMQNLRAEEIRSRVEEMLGIVGLTGLADRGASFLSGGQMQRVALARSLVMRPAVLLFDEPLSNLDARLRDHLRVELRELQTGFGITSVFVTHDQQEALALADEVAVMQSGRILQRDEPVEVYTRPISSTVADFIGYRNIFQVEAKQRDGRTIYRLLGVDFDFVAAHPMPASQGGIFACIRPEDVRMDPDDGSDTPLKGEVTLASFMGSHIHYRVRLDTGAIVEVYGRAAPDRPRIGARVVVHMPPEAVQLLPKDV